MKTEDQKKRTAERRAAIEDIILSNKSKLLTCPFCGDFPIMERGCYDNLIDPVFRIRCDCMEDNGYDHPGIRTPQYRNVELLIKKWNTRIAPLKTVEAVENIA